MLLNASRFLFLPNYYLLIYRNCLKINFNLIDASLVSWSLLFQRFSITFKGFNPVFSRFEGNKFILLSRLLDSHWPWWWNSCINFWFIIIWVNFCFSYRPIKIVSNNFELWIILISNNFCYKLSSKPLIFSQVFIINFGHTSYNIFIFVTVWKLYIKCFIAIYWLIYHSLLTICWINFPKLFLSQILHLEIVNMVSELFPAFACFIMRFRSYDSVES